MTFQHRVSMATPRVFISSTCYDLKHIRESLKYFVKSIGYEPVLSEDGDVFYSPSSHTHDSCLDEVATCQMFVLIIGGRYGGKHKESDKSITNEEYIAAIGQGIPVFTLVDTGTYADHHLYTSNKNNSEIDRDKIKYPASDSIKIFKFIDDVRKHSINNAIQPFKNFLDIECYLKKQWSGMMFDLLQKARNEKQALITNKLLNDLSEASKKTEELIKFLVSSADKENAKSVIENIDLLSKARKFPNLVLSQWNIDNFSNLKIDDLDKIVLPENWYDYLQSAFGFRVDYIYENHDMVLWAPDEKGGSGLAIANINIDESLDFHDADEKESYDAFRRLSPEERKQVLSIFVKGI